MLKTENLEKIPPEVLIYMQKIRHHLSVNDQAREYFKIDIYGDNFFEEVLNVAKKNFETTGEPALSLEQFEEIRGDKEPKSIIYGVFMNLGDLGFISLN